MKKEHLQGFAVVGGLLALAALASALFLFGEDYSYAREPNKDTNASYQEPVPPQEPTPEELAAEGKHIVVVLDAMMIMLKDGETILATLPIVSKGKPGSYYETPAGIYAHDYKIPLHFSSIGHVYMPSSVHVFGNFFIHGIPYYPSGEKVASTYSGGCIRLADDDAKRVYDFVTRGMPIIITEESIPTVTPEPLDDMRVTELMVAAISLEFLSQDNEVIFQGISTTRKKLLRRLLDERDTDVSRFYAGALAEKTFVDIMNTKARAIGMHNTTFIKVDEAPMITEEDKLIFARYIAGYKSYLLTLRDPGVVIED